MPDYSAVLRELMLAGYEGATLLRAFERMCAAIGGAVAPAAEPVAASAPVSPAAPLLPAAIRPKARAVTQPDRRQLNLVLAMDGGRAKTAPLSDAERQAVRRARRENVTLRAINARQVIEIIEESRNVTETCHVTPQVVEKPALSADASRDSVTRRGKKRSPHTPLRKTNPQNTPRHVLPHIPWDSPLMPFLEHLNGKPFPRFGSGRTVSRDALEAAQRLMAERGAPMRQAGAAR